MFSNACCSVSVSVVQLQTSMQFREVCTLPGRPSACQGHDEGYGNRLLEVLPRLLVWAFIDVTGNASCSSCSLADPFACS